MSASICKGVPCLAVLVGRARGYMVCCGEMQSCDRALRSTAAFLAEELGNDAEAAVSRTIDSYRADVGSHFISQDRAAWLRALTVEACLRETLGVTSCLGVMVADDDFESSAGRTSESSSSQASGRPAVQTFERAVA